MARTPESGVILSNDDRVAIVEEFNRLQEAEPHRLKGEIGDELAERYGVSSSTIGNWRLAYDQGRLTADSDTEPVDVRSSGPLNWEAALASFKRLQERYDKASEPVLKARRELTVAQSTLDRAVANRKSIEQQLEQATLGLAAAVQSKNNTNGEHDSPESSEQNDQDEQTLA